MKVIYVDIDETICHRETSVDFGITHDYTKAQPIKENIEKALIDFKGKYDIIKVPNITNICYGRGVGYKIEEIVLTEEIQNISATKIRKGEIKNEF